VPEGDTVYRSAKQLNAALAGTVLTRCDIRVPAFATVDLSGEVVHNVASRGKHLIMHIGEYTIHSHLKMEGSWRIFRGQERWTRPAYLARGILANSEYTAVGFELGTLNIVRTEDEGTLVDYLGPDLLGADWDAELALANLRLDPDREIGLALLDQRNLAGIGNVYRAEMLFRARLNPFTPGRELREEQVRALWKDWTKLLKIGVETGQMLTMDGLRGKKYTAAMAYRADRHWAYHRTGEPCRVCGTPIRMQELGGRKLYWCPTDQT
jgi:endonuclease-8